MIGLSWPRIKLWVALTAISGSCLVALAIGAAAPRAFADPPDNALPTGTYLDSGEELVSSDGIWHLAMQTDGNLVRFAFGGPLWETGTWGHPGAYVVNQDDGNLVIYSAEDVPLWSSGRYTASETELVVQDDGNVVQYAANSGVVWFSNTVYIPPFVGDRLNGGDIIRSGQRMSSAKLNANYLFMQSDGNVVSYAGSGLPRWSSGPAGSGSFFTVQTDGNAVLYNAAGRAAFSTGTAGNPGAYLVMQNDGRLVLYSPDGRVLWFVYSRTVFDR
ncbi:MAG: hypothetical protein JWM76_716 [Pseudonocardiales bacterium]|nr:hypothetical protein [Pseudonocardiales bacterium]